jgi:bifunctional non-homologous end joining protein LigD
VSRDRVRVRVDSCELSLSNLDKVMYPATGFTKAQVLDYYTRVAPALLPHLRGRPFTFKRFPDGVDAEFFFEKNAPQHTPHWVRRVRLPTPGSTKNRDTINFVVVDDLATLVWAVNLATLEMHVPMWRLSSSGSPQDADLMVFDLDPGPPATVVECTRVALLVREELGADGLQAWAKTSGNKGMQLYVPVRLTASEQTSTYAKELAQRLERAYPDLVVSRMAKALRPGKVLVDWSQNNAAKTTVAVYSLRARAEPTVSTPVTWEEVGRCRTASDLRFTAEQVLERVDAIGDLFSPLQTQRQTLPERGR